MSLAENIYSFTLYLYDKFPTIFHQAHTHLYAIFQPISKMYFRFKKRNDFGRTEMYRNKFQHLKIRVYGINCET